MTESMETAPRDGRWIEGRSAPHRPWRRMRYAERTPKTPTDALLAELLFGTDSPVWWAVYDDGEEGSFLPTEWRNIPP